MTDLISSAHVATTGSAPSGETQWIRSAADVSRLVNSGDSARNNARIVVAIALGGVFLDAYDLGALAFGIKDVAREFNLTPTGTGMIASTITFGAIIGALIGGYLTDKIGRYRVFMADMFFFRGGGNRLCVCAKRICVRRSAFRDGARRRHRSAGGDGLPGRVFEAAR